MFRLKENIHVQAPIERCFLLSTSIELVQQILGLHPVSGKTTGLIQYGDRIVWRGWKFGLPAYHETLISRCEPYGFFQDTMGKGLFKSFQHDHQFDDIDGHTLMIDIVRFSLPLGLPGRWVGKTIVVPHVLDLLLRRFQLLKRIAEGDDWQKYIPAGSHAIAIDKAARHLQATQQELDATV